MLACIRRLEAGARCTESYGNAVCNLRLLEGQGILQSAFAVLSCKVSFLFKFIRLFSFLKYCHVHIRFNLELYLHTSLSCCYLLVNVMLLIGYPKTLRVAPLPCLWRHVPPYLHLLVFKGFSCQALVHLVSFNHNYSKNIVSILVLNKQYNGLAGWPTHPVITICVVQGRDQPG